MKISKSKQELARIISENGGWRDGSEFAAQDSNKNTYGARVCFYHSKPYVNGSEWIDGSNGLACNAGECIDGLMAINNWHQTILSREEYFHLHPSPDADGWIEWGGGECPVGDDSIVDVMFCNGRVGIGLSPLPAGGAGREGWRLINGRSDIIAYRLHKPEQAKPEFCESVMRSIPGPDEQVWTNPPTIEQLAADYRNAKDYADRKQQEADAAKVDADEKLRVLEIAGEAHGLIVSPITVKQEPELMITNRSQLELGDVIWLSDSTVKENNELTPSGEYTVVKVGVIGVESDGQTIYPDFSTREWRFIRRP